MNMVLHRSTTKTGRIQRLRLLRLLILRVRAARGFWRAMATAWIPSETPLFPVQCKTVEYPILSSGVTQQVIS